MKGPLKFLSDIWNYVITSRGYYKQLREDITRGLKEGETFQELKREYWRVFLETDSFRLLGLVKGVDPNKWRGATEVVKGSIGYVEPHTPLSEFHRFEGEAGIYFASCPITPDTPLEEAVDIVHQELNANNCPM